MSKIRQTLITNCEKKFLLKCLTDHTRLDGRSFDEFRPLSLKFGQDWGSCYVSLGETRVSAQTSCEIQHPTSSRPSEGILNVNIELSPLAAPDFEAGRQTELSVQLNRLLEKCIKDSNAVDLESLCIKSSEKVWALRVDINVINHEGNILDCASIALLASLAHFRRPDVTCDGEQFIIHSSQQRDPIATVIHHWPVYITYSVFNGGEYVLADPTLIEEGSADAILNIGLNGFNEICSFHLGGKVGLMPHVIINTVSKATSRATKVIEEIKNSIKSDNEDRQNKVPVGFHVQKTESTVTDEIGISLDHWNEKEKKKRNKKQEKEAAEEEKLPKIETVDQGSAAFVPQDGGKVEWVVDSSEDDLVIVEKPKVSIEILDSQSEEDDVVILDSGQI